MDIQLKKKHWIIRYRYLLLGCLLFAGLLIYVIILTFGPHRLQIDTARPEIQTAVAQQKPFLEYIDAEGLVHPILTLQVNARESGNVASIVREEGSMVRKGDTIMILNNDDLKRSIEEERDAWEKEQYNYREHEITMQQQSLDLRQQSLETRYEMDRMKQNMAIEKEEYQMGIKSKAQFQVAESEFKFKKKKAEMKMESLKHDSAVSTIRKELLRNDLERGRKKWERSQLRMNRLVITAPVSGQLGFIDAVPGQLITVGQRIAQIKVLDSYKIQTQLSEYYVDRIVSGLPATILYQGKRFPLKIRKVVPEVKERVFDVDLVFTDQIPDNIRVGKSYRLQIELGQSEKVLTIPRGDFYQRTGGHWIYKISPDGTKARKTPITIGRQNPMQYEITGGLAPGDRVVTTGYDKFEDAEELILK